MTAHRPFQEVDAAAAHKLIERGDAILVDVRERTEHARERIAGAILAPLSNLDPHAVKRDGSKLIILHCASGQRSARAAQMFLAAGVAHVAHLRGGLPAWRKAGFPVTIDRHAPLPLQRQVQIVAGSLVVTGIVLGLVAHPWFLGLAGFVGAGLIFAGASGWCGMAELLGRLPYNRTA